MCQIRKIAAWIVLASYLFANTFASALHDHGSCVGRCDGSEHGRTDLAANGGHNRCCHGHHSAHGPGHEETSEPAHHVHGTCQHHQHADDAPVVPDRNENGGDGDHDSQHCVVCSFLALASVATPRVALEPAGEVLPVFVVMRVLPVSTTAVETDRARGPPAV